MLIQKLNACDEFIAGDGTQLRELLHPDKQSVEVRYSFAHATLPPGQTSALHSLTTSEVYYIISGVGKCTSTAKINLWKPEIQFTFRQTPSSLFATAAQNR